MPLFRKAQAPEPAHERTYTKHDTEYWNQPTLADKIEQWAREGKSYDECREAAYEEGYKPYWFTQSLAQLRNEGVIKFGYRSVELNDEDASADGLSDWG